MSEQLFGFGSALEDQGQIVRSNGGHKYLCYNETVVKESILGEGGFGAVTVAFKFDEIYTPYAVKKIELNNEQDRKVVQNEIKLLQLVNNDCVLAIHDYAELDNHFYLFTDLLGTDNLQNYFEEFNDCLSEQSVWVICTQIAEGLSALHAKEIIHRDLKPANVLMDYRGLTILSPICRLADLGLATLYHETSDSAQKAAEKRKKVQKFRLKCSKKAMENESTSTAAVDKPAKSLFVHSATAGTNGFQAPEIILANIPMYSRKADIWSFGALIYYMICNNKPSTSDAPTKIIPAGYNKCSPELEDFVTKCLINDQFSRPSIDQLISHPFLNPGMQHLRIWRNELILIVTFSLFYEKLAKKAASSSQKTLMPADKLAQNVALWAYGFDFHRRRLVEHSGVISAMMHWLSNKAEAAFIKQTHQQNMDLQNAIQLIVKRSEVDSLNYFDARSLGYSTSQRQILKQLIKRLNAAENGLVQNLNGFNNIKFYPSLLFGQVVVSKLDNQLLDLCSSLKNMLVVHEETTEQMHPDYEQFFENCIQKLTGNDDSAFEFVPFLMIIFSEYKQLPTALNCLKWDTQRNYPKDCGITRKTLFNQQSNAPSFELILFTPTGRNAKKVDGMMPISSLIIQNTAVHNGVKPFKCNFCGKCYNLKYVRDCHIKHVHELQKN